jgi:hypothetical protein
MATNFIIKDRNNTNLPMEQTHYYNWLKNANLKDIHYVNTKKEYLTQEGFKIGVDSLNESDLSILKYIEQYFFNQNLKTTN